jgi:D-xylose transport system substrate-binding protein
MKGIRSLFFGMLILSLLLASCATPAAQPAAEQPTAAGGGQQAAGPKYHRIAYLGLDTTVKRYIATDVPSMEKVLLPAGYELIFQSAEFDQKAQINQAETVLIQGVDVIILQPVDDKAAAVIVEQAAAEGVPVISYNDLVANADIAAFVGRDPAVGGSLSAEAAVKVHPTGNYVLVGGDESSTVARGFMEGYHQVLDPLVAEGKIKIVSEQYHVGWDPKGAVAQTENALTQNNNDVVAVLANNDNLAFGAIEALNGAGLKDGPGADQVYVTGQDCIDGALQAIAEGRFGGTIWGGFNDMGRLAAETAIELAEGKQVTSDTTINNGLKDVPWIQAPIYLVTADNLAKFACDTYTFWVGMKTIYANVPDKIPTCK